MAITLSNLFILLTLISSVIVVIVCIKDYLNVREWERIRKVRREIELENNSWMEFHLDPPNNTIECIEAIIDDALCYGFEFKVDNGKIYFRERTDIL